ncbi:hypothetical protein, partial [Shewanella sp. T24-MNA-CIBAN-0130]|uniref:hypothetical protein n=1 Tax=Shewanella sp. T24-MNA-CIBAN-0130 TaxID=3140470 RepID=UPI003320AA4A
MITYVLTEGSGANDTSTLSLTVTPVNDDFTDNNETRTIAEDSPQDVSYNHLTLPPNPAGWRSGWAAVG